MIDAKVLHGWSLERAELMGKPHIGALYVSQAGYARTANHCAICGAPASNVHHIGRRTPFTMTTKHGGFVLRSGLMALCGSGTYGCHGKVHDGDIKISWHWDKPEYEEMWWSGEFFANGMKEHDPRLFSFGYYEVKIGREVDVIRKCPKVYVGELKVGDRLARGRKLAIVKSVDPDVLKVEIDGAETHLPTENLVYWGVCRG